MYQADGPDAGEGAYVKLHAPAVEFDLPRSNRATRLSTARMAPTTQSVPACYAAHYACSVADSSKRLWINCGGCERNEYVETHEWAVRHKVDFDTPILLINPRLRCSKCGERK